MVERVELFFIYTLGGEPLPAGQKATVVLYMWLRYESQSLWTWSPNQTYLDNPITGKCPQFIHAIAGKNWRGQEKDG